MSTRDLARLSFIQTNSIREPIPSYILSKNASSCAPDRDDLLEECRELFDCKKTYNTENMKILFNADSNNYDVHLIHFLCPAQADNVFAVVGFLVFSLLGLQMRIETSDVSFRNQLINFDEGTNQNNVEYEHIMVRVVYIVKEILAICFNEAATKYYWNKQTSCSQSDLDYVKTTIVNIWNVVFLINPSIMEYMKDIVFYQNSPADAWPLPDTVRKHLEGMKDYKRDWILWNKLFTRSEDHKEPTLISYDFICAITANDKYNSMWIKYKKLYEDLYKMFDSVSDMNILDLVKRLDDIGTNAFKLKTEFGLLKQELEISKKNKSCATDEDPSTELFETFIDSCSVNLPKFSIFFDKIFEYARILDKFNGEEDSFHKMFWACVQTSLARITEYQQSVIWNSGFLSYDTYIWETVKLIEAGTANSSIIAKHIAEMLRWEGNEYHQRFFDNYNFLFPGLLKAICDRSLESLKFIYGLFPAENVVEKIVNGKGGVEQLIDLYVTIWKAKNLNTKNDSSETNKEVFNSKPLKKHLLKGLKKRRVENTWNIPDKNKKESIIIIYALQLIAFFDENFANNGISARFRISKWVEQHLCKRPYCVW